jgi:hypothetical protein
MPFTDPWFREGKTNSPLDFERRQYEQTKNPVHVWRGYQICRECRCESLPHWILDYLDAVASAVMELRIRFEDGPIKQLPAQIADIFGFQRAGQGVRDTAFSEVDRRFRDQGLAITVRRLIRTNPDISRETIIAAVAEREHVSDETVRRAY